MNLTTARSSIRVNEVGIRIIKERLLANPDVLRVSAASSIPLSIGNNNPVYWEGRGPDSYVSMNFVKKTIAAVVPGYPVEPEFLDEHFQRQYINEDRLGKILTSFTGLAIFISCLGLFGVAAFMAARRSKEIAIRKVLGASIWSVTRILNREFIVLIVLANIIAWPLGLFVMSRWMRNFSYHTSIGLGVFIAAGTGALAIALLTVSYQTFRSATANPADRLRNE
jgi:putative ABC transport system permease protein